MEDAFYTAISRRLIEARRIQGKYSQRAAAKALGISQSTYSQYESEKFGIPVHAVARCAKLYDVSIDWLVTGHEAEASAPKGEARPGLSLSSAESVNLIAPLDLLLKFARLTSLQRSSIRKLRRQLADISSREADPDGGSDQ